MGQFTNVRIIGTGGGADARSSTGDSTTGADYTQLNIVNLGNFWVHSLSGVVPSTFIKTSASAGPAGTAIQSTNLVGGYGVHSASSLPISAAGFLSVIDSAGVQWAIPLMKPS